MSVDHPPARAPGRPSPSPSLRAPRSPARLPPSPSVIVSGLISDWADPSTTVELTADEIAALTAAADAHSARAAVPNAVPTAVIDREVTEPFAYAGIAGAFPIVRIPAPTLLPTPTLPTPTLPAPSVTAPGPTTAALDPVPWAHAAPVADGPPPPRDHFFFVILFLSCLVIALLSWGVLLL